jgi:hypothetical protein
MPVYLRIEKPYIIDWEGRRYSDPAPESVVKGVYGDSEFYEVSWEELIDHQSGKYKVHRQYFKDELDAKMFIDDVEENEIEANVIDYEVKDEIFYLHDVLNTIWKGGISLDGFVFKRIIDPAVVGDYNMKPTTVYAVLNPKQIKSVYNEGSWSPNSRDIMK